MKEVGVQSLCLKDPPEKEMALILVFLPGESHGQRSNLATIPWRSKELDMSKFGKLSSGQRTGKGQFSFQSQRKAMPKNAQTTA